MYHLRAFNAAAELGASPTRMKTACDRCARMKTKCDSQQPCARCRRSSWACSYKREGYSDPYQKFRVNTAHDIEPTRTNGSTTTPPQADGALDSVTQNRESQQQPRIQDTLFWSFLENDMAGNPIPSNVHSQSQTSAVVDASTLGLNPVLTDPDLTFEPPWTVNSTPWFLEPLGQFEDPLMEEIGVNKTVGGQWKGLNK